MVIHLLTGDTNSPQAGPWFRWLHLFVQEIKLKTRNNHNKDTECNSTKKLPPDMDFQSLCNTHGIFFSFLLL